jgi:hypothetical protein
MADKAGRRMGYTLGITGESYPYEFPGRTNSGDFQSMLATEGGYYAVGSRYPRRGSGRSRLAGEAFNVDLNSLAAAPLPLDEPYAAGGEIDALEEDIY